MNAIKDIRYVEQVIGVCCGRPRESELPQIADEEAVIISLLHKTCTKPWEELEAEVHCQIDPTYQ